MPQTGQAASELCSLLWAWLSLCHPAKLIRQQVHLPLQVTAAIKVSKNKGIVCSKTLVAAAGKEELVKKMCKEVTRSGSSTLWCNSCQVVGK